MTELILIRINESEKLKEFLQQENINYETFYERESNIQEDKLLQEYQEAWKDPRRIAEAKQWEQAAMNDWTERAKKEKK